MPYKAQQFSRRSEPSRSERVSSRYRSRLAPRKTGSPVSHLHDVASGGVAGAGSSLPYLGQIQRAFGRHKVDSVTSHQDRQAQQANRSLGVKAYARGEQIAFQHSPSLEDAAHEAAHVVQQRSDRVAGGQVSGSADRHEQHADRVAQAVVQGRSAEALLNQYPAASAKTEPAVQARGGVIIDAPEGETLPPHPGAEGEKPFSTQEREWIDQILAHRVFQILFASYEEIPPAVLHRVREKGGANGSFNGANSSIALTDKIYENKGYHHLEGERFQETDEEAFKGTFVHEMFHYLEHNADTKMEGELLPRDLMEFMLYPESLGLPEYAFGWFVHPQSRYIQHFQQPQLDYITGPRSIAGFPELIRIRQEGNWERSPMPESGGSTSREEDMAESFSRMMSSDRVRLAFKAAYPLRYQLLERYLGHLIELLQKRAGQ